jgi:diaminopimelate decarboxylase
MPFTTDLLTRIIQAYGTPTYVYDAALIRGQIARVRAAFPQAKVRYAVKANNTLGVLRLVHAAGYGFDIVSGGELARVLAAGADPGEVVFAGVGKTRAEMRLALEARVGWFVCESADELERLAQVASAVGRRGQVALRLNPDVAPETHPHIQTGAATSKFGLPLDQARALFAHRPEWPTLDLAGVHVHIGSQMQTTAPWAAAAGTALACAREVGARMLDLGGGFPVAYQADDRPPDVAEFATAARDVLAAAAGLDVHLEPGRYLVAEAGVLLTEIQAIKHMAGRRVIVVDTGMHHLLRPALYGARHRMTALTASGPSGSADVVGPICESADRLATDIALPGLNPGDHLVIHTVGAYGSVMASTYNAQPRPAEVMVDGESITLTRRRETIADLAMLDA